MRCTCTEAFRKSSGDQINREVAGSKARQCCSDSHLPTLAQFHRTWSFQPFNLGTGIGSIMAPDKPRVSAPKSARTCDICRQRKASFHSTSETIEHSQLTDDSSSRRSSVSLMLKMQADPVRDVRNSMSTVPSTTSARSLAENRRECRSTGK